MSQPIQRHPPLAPEHMFVVQLHADMQVEAGQMAGRIEHLVSRQAIMFESLETLLAFMARVLREVREASGSAS
jgi:hypothetical protein